MTAHIENIHIRIEAGTPQLLPALPNPCAALAASFERSLQQIDDLMNMSDEELADLKEAAGALGRLLPDESPSPAAGGGWATCSSPA